MDEYTFWSIYFTLCKRYLPKDATSSEPVPTSPASVSTSTAAANTTSTSHGAPTPLHSSALSPAAGSRGVAGTKQNPEAPVGHTDRTPGSNSPHSTGITDAVMVDEGDIDKFTDLDNDPELDAYLQEALHADVDHPHDDEAGSGLGSDVGDLDDYINQLDAEISQTSLEDKTTK